MWEKFFDGAGDIIQGLTDPTAQESKSREEFKLMQNGDEEKDKPSQPVPTEEPAPAGPTTTTDDDPGQSQGPGE